MTRRHSENELQACIGGRPDSEDLRLRLHGNVTEQKAALRDMLQGPGWDAEELFEALEMAEDFSCERIGLNHVFWCWSHKPPVGNCFFLEILRLNCFSRLNTESSESEKLPAYQESL